MYYIYVNINEIDFYMYFIRNIYHNRMTSNLLGSFFFFLVRFTCLEIDMYEMSLHFISETYDFWGWPHKYNHMTTKIIRTSHVALLFMYGLNLPIDFLNRDINEESKYLWQYILRTLFVLALSPNPTKLMLSLDLIKQY